MFVTCYQNIGVGYNPQNQIILARNIKCTYRSITFYCDNGHAHEAFENWEKEGAPDVKKRNWNITGWNGPALIFTIKILVA